ncbi:MAG TPA: DUF3316 domain-containing protein [Paludibacter sp.]|nr:DUF3316 domain-containing protein [Paludibacter sp.]
MKKWIFFLFLIFCFQMQAQNSLQRQFPLTTVSDLAGISVLNLQDAYLSPLTYSGLGVFVEHREQKLFSPDNTKLSMQTKLNGLIGITVNPKSTASIAYMGAAGSWGAFYHFNNIADDLYLSAGSTLDAGFAVKQNGRNVNNPYNFDLATNINLAAVANYDISVFRKLIRLNFEIEAPVLGCMFVPEAGISYYEMFELMNLNNTFHFSSLHNRQGMSLNTAIEIPFKNSTWKFGIGANKLKYTANEMIFEHNELKMFVGWKYNIYRFTGTQNKAPDNFVSAYK